MYPFTFKRRLASRGKKKLAQWVRVCRAGARMTLEATFCLNSPRRFSASMRSLSFSFSSAPLALNPAE